MAGEARHKAEEAGPGHDNLWDRKERRPYVATTSERSHPKDWEGPTYYGRSQLKAAPFNNWVVGGYIFLAGLSGGAAIVSTAAEAVRGDRAYEVGRRGRYTATLAPTIGALLLIWDLHTPQRFYNMWRIFKTTSPMSLGTWILTAFHPELDAGRGAAVWRGRVAALAVAEAGGEGGQRAISRDRGGSLRLHRLAAGGDEHTLLGGRAAGAGGAFRRVVHRLGHGGAGAG